MRDLTEKEKKELRKGCLFCRHDDKFAEGPSGGLCTNIYCTNCGAGYNVAPGLMVAQLIQEPTKEYTPLVVPKSVPWWRRIFQRRSA